MATAVVLSYPNDEFAVLMFPDTADRDGKVF